MNAVWVSLCFAGCCSASASPPGFSGFSLSFSLACLSPLTLLLFSLLSLASEREEERVSNSEESEERVEGKGSRKGVSFFSVSLVVVFLELSFSLSVAE